MKRLVDWEVRFQQLMEDRKETPFQRGTHDCTIFACDVVHAITGEDPGKKFRGKFKTKRGAASILRKAGKTLAEMVAYTLEEQFKCPSVHPAKAQRGDAVLIETEESVAVGNVDLDGMNIIIADQGCEKGYAKLPLSLATKAWRIG